MTKIARILLATTLFFSVKSFSQVYGQFGVASGLVIGSGKSERIIADSLTASVYSNTAFSLNFRSVMEEFVLDLNGGWNRAYFRGEDFYYNVNCFHIDYGLGWEFLQKKKWHASSVIAASVYFYNQRYISPKVNDVYSALASGQNKTVAIDSKPYFMLGQNFRLEFWPTKLPSRTIFATYYLPYFRAKGITFAEQQHLRSFHTFQLGLSFYGKFRSKKAVVV